MLPPRLLRLEVHRDVVVPGYLTARDEPWLRVLLDEVDGFAGRTVSERDTEIEHRLDRALPRGVASRLVVSGVLHVLGRLWRTRLDAPIAPARIRRVVFEQAAVDARFDRAGALDRAARLLGLDRDVLEPSLFADRAGARRLVAPEPPLGPREAALLYNLALLQGLLRASEAARVHVRAHVRAVVRYAKLLRLICTYRIDQEGTHIHLSGPLSIFRLTTKYGHAIASFLPSVVATPGWSLEARCLIRGRRVRFRASHIDPIAATHALPRDSDSAVERALCRDFRRLGSPWTLARETAAIPTPGGGVFFPDFTLTRGETRLLVELCGFYTPEYLASKLAALRAAREHRVIVLIDDSLACGRDEIEASAVIRYRKRVDAAALLTAADRLHASDV